MEVGSTIVHTYITDLLEILISLFFFLETFAEKIVRMRE